MSFGLFQTGGIYFEKAFIRIYGTLINSRLHHRLQHKQCSRGRQQELTNSNNHLP